MLNYFKVGAIKKYNSVVFFLLIHSVFIAQVTNDERKYYIWFDGVIGQDHIGLCNGKQYFDTDKSVLYDIEKHVYFGSSDFLKGSLVYDNQVYYDSNMQYNLETDDLVLSLKSEKLVSVIKLIKDKIRKFTIDGHTFINVNFFVEDSSFVNTNGFQEILLESHSFILLKKHKKKRAKKIKQLEGRRHLYYSFTSFNSYGVLINNSYKKIKSKSDVIKLYPSLKKEVSGYYNANWRLRKSEPDRFIRALFRQVIASSFTKKKS